MSARPLPHTPCALEVQSLARRYGALAALRAVSFHAAPGEILCLLGSSGCGKSTLLRLIAGLEMPDGGSIRMDGMALSDAQTFVPPEQRGIGLVFQDYALFPHLSLLDNVAFGLRGARGGREAAARAALARVRLEERAGSFPHMLSGGEQQRVALARALAPRPRLLLMDEPFSNLDRGLRESVRAETLAILREEGTTAIIVTHDPEEALRIADRIVLMRAGSVEQDAVPEDLYCRPASLYAARFFGELIELSGVVRNGRVVTPLGVFDASSLPEGQQATLALRPHHLRLAADGLAAGVQARTFLGPAVQLRLGVEGLAAPLLLNVDASCPARPGNRVHLTVDTHAALVFGAA
ncbi:MAG: ABC transporter ATP-binding protein [Pseudomonadota bacterium]|nr:ABC transporter ATP-binding protein [Pseudomonadota bacterium]